MAVTLDNRKRCVKRHPIYKVGHLAQTAAHAVAEGTVFKHHSLDISLFAGGRADKIPIAEGFTGFKYNSV